MKWWPSTGQGHPAGGVQVGGGCRRAVDPAGAPGQGTPRVAGDARRRGRLDDSSGSVCAGTRWTEARVRQAHRGPSSMPRLGPSDRVDRHGRQGNCQRRVQCNCCQVPGDAERGLGRCSAAPGTGGAAAQRGAGPRRRLRGGGAGHQVLERVLRCHGLWLMPRRLARRTCSFWRKRAAANSAPSACSANLAAGLLRLLGNR